MTSQVLTFPQEPMAETMLIEASRAASALETLTAHALSTAEVMDGNERICGRDALTQLTMRFLELAKKAGGE